MLRDKRVVRFNGAVMETEMGIMTAELVIAPAPPKIKKGTSDPLRDRREHYELQLGRPVSDQELEYLP